MAGLRAAAAGGPLTLPRLRHTHADLLVQTIHALAQEGRLEAMEEHRCIPIHIFEEERLLRLWEDLRPKVSVDPRLVRSGRIPLARPPDSGLEIVQSQAASAIEGAQ